MQLMQRRSQQRGPAAGGIKIGAKRMMTNKQAGKISK
jgi:hypothetical protein